MRKYYDEDEDEFEQASTTDEQHSFLPAVRLQWWDWALALVVGLLAFAGLVAFAFPGLCPDVWEDAVVAAGLRPPQAIFPGFWRVIARAFYLGGVEVGNAGLVWTGRVCAALTGVMGYLFLRSLLALLVRGRLRYAVQRYVVQSGAAFLGALFFVCTDPVWRAGQAFTPGALLMLLTLVQVTLFTGFLLNGRLASALGSMFLVGLISAETPMGFLLLIGCWVVYMLALRHDALCEHMPLLDPIIGPTAKWKLTLLWALGLILGIALNCTSFISMEGLTAAGKAGSDMPLMYLLGWWNLVMDAASVMGWILGLGVCALPFAVAAVMLPRAVDEEQFLPYHVGAVFFFTGALAFSQVCMLPPLWFWSWTDAVSLNSFYLQQLLMLCACGTVTFALTTLGGDACCRNHVRLATQRFAELREANEGNPVASVNVSRGKRGGLVVFFVAALLLVAAVVPGRTLSRTREMLEIIEDYAKEVVEECGPVQWLFTDGSFDARIELGAAERGRQVKTLSMMAHNSPYQQYLRKRGVTDAEDQMTLAMGAPMALRSWMRDKPARMRDAAIQLGFELWKRDGKELPVCSGVLARPLGMDAAECDAGVTRANALAERILALHEGEGLEKAAGRTIRELFLFAQWRIARLARMRAERADRAGDTQAAMKDVKISDRLDNTNESLQRILATMEKAKATTLKQVTPREGLQLALARADFVLARRYGETILEADPDEPNANFGVGMSYYTQKQWSRAEEFLRRCLVRKPKEPAVWNNLALICMHTERFDEAERHARQALAFIPESAEVKDTLKEIAEARKAAAEKTSEKKGAAPSK